MKRRDFLKAVGVAVVAPVVVAKEKPDVLTTDKIKEIKRKALLAEPQIKPDENGMIDIRKICGVKKHRFNSNEFGCVSVD